MLTVGDQRHKRPHPKGQRFQMIDEWKAGVIAELDRRDEGSDPAWHGRARTELARRLGRSKSTVTKMLQGKQTVSALVPMISKILNVPPPVLGTNAEIAELVRQLDDKGVELTLELLRRLVK
jgi:transcriptional regulator with XRE-family HTH domain